jgi:hypothetical protein
MKFKTVRKYLHPLKLARNTFQIEECNIERDKETKREREIN